METVGIVSNGTMVWYDATKCYTLHPGAADLQMIASPATLRIVGGAGEISRYFVGMIIQCSGFANAVNNLPGYAVTAVVVNGADLDLSLRTFGGILIDEAAAGARTIKIVCQTVHAYCAAMNAVVLAGYSDWRVPKSTELVSLLGCEVNALPDAIAFPLWINSLVFSGTTRPDVTTSAFWVNFANGEMRSGIKSAAASYAAFVRVNL